MKNFVFILFSLVALNLLADGGDDSKRFRIDGYDPHLNLQFIGVKDTLHHFDKRKDLKVFVYSNIAIYDIANRKTNYVFKDSVKQQIVGFYFESKYIDEYKTIEFNNSYDPSDEYKNGLFENSNNKNVSSRPLSNNLIIITENVLTKNLTFWICDKFGNNLKKEMEISKDWDWEIDVKNRLIRFTKQVNLKIEIQNINY